jgi:iron complex outermembrane receptor protein
MYCLRTIAHATALFAPLSCLAQPLPVIEHLTDEVVVTASRFPGSGFSAPIGARIISARQIIDSGAANVAEALNRLGGVHVRQDLFGGTNPGLDLRGFGVTGDQNTLVLVDGVRLSENELLPARLSGIAIDAVDRIEILPGGGAVLYGSNTTGGVINVITRQPQQNLREAKVSASAGTFGTRDVRGSASVAGEQLSLSLQAQDYRTDNERRNNRVDQQNMGGALSLRTRETDLAFTFGSERQKAGMPGARSALNWKRDPNGANTPEDFSTNELWHAGLSARQRIGEVELAASLVRRDRHTEYFNDYGSGAYGNDHRRVVSHEFTPRLRWSTQFGTQKNELVAGFDWRDWDFHSDKMENFGFGFAGPSAEKGKQRTEAWYVQDTVQITDTTRISLGGRTEALEVERVVPFALAMTPVLQNEQHRLHAWSFSVQQALASNLTAHARSGTSYRIPNIDENRCYAAPCALLKPQTSRDNEIGLAWRGAQWSGSINLFDLALENELYYNNLLMQNSNLPPTRRRGAELAGAWAPLSRLSLEARYTLTDATFRSGAFAGVAIRDKTVPVVPRHRATLNATWTASDRDRLFLGLNYVGTQQFDNDPANRFSKMPAYTTADAKYSHQIGNTTLSLAVSNLFDKRYYSYALVNSATNPTNYNVYPDRSRTVLATFDYAFR